MKNGTMAKKAYFLLSAGWGPVVRALPIANALKRNGVKTYFHVSGKVAEAMSRAGHELKSPAWFPQKGEPKRDWWNLDQLLADFGWNNRTFVENRFNAYREAVESVRPDVMVVDFNTTAMLVARSLKIPTLAIVQSCFHPARARPYIVWWKDPPENIPTVTPVINEILVRNGARPVGSAEELQVGDITAIPSFPEFDPLAAVDEMTRYVGPILGNDDVNPGAAQPDNSNEKIIIVYPGRPRDMGGESGALIMRTVVPVLERLNIPAIVSRGEFDYPEYSASRGRVSFVPWVSLSRNAPRCELMIHHGGHGACLSSLMLGVPSLVIPTFAEREYNARNLEKIGCAISLPPEILSDEEVTRAISLLQTSKYSDQTGRWKEEIARRNYGGVDEVARLVLKIV